MWYENPAVHTGNFLTWLGCLCLSKLCCTILSNVSVVWYNQEEINIDSSFLTGICFVSSNVVFISGVKIVWETMSNLGSFPLSYLTTYIRKGHFHVLLTLILTLIEDKSLPKITMLNSLNYEQWEFSLLGLTAQCPLRCYAEWRFSWKKRDWGQN